MDEDFNEKKQGHVTTSRDTSPSTAQPAFPAEVDHLFWAHLLSHFTSVLIASKAKGVKSRMLTAYLLSDS
jgi:hypothetical protein